MKKRIMSEKKNRKATKNLNKNACTGHENKKIPLLTNQNIKKRELKADI